MIKEIKLLDSCRIVGMETNKIYVSSVSLQGGIITLNVFNENGYIGGVRVTEELRVEQARTDGTYITIAYTTEY